MDRNPPMTDDKLYTSHSANTVMAKLTKKFFSIQLSYFEEENRNCTVFWQKSLYVLPQYNGLPLPMTS